MQGMLFGKKQFFLSITFFVSCKIIFVPIIFFALTVCLKINPIHLDENGNFFLYSMPFCQGKLLCWNSFVEIAYLKNIFQKIVTCYFLIRFSEAKITLFIFFSKWVWGEKDFSFFLLVRLSSRARCCEHIKLQVSFAKIFLSVRQY